MSFSEVYGDEDQVSEAYYGELWSESATARAKKRVHWICKNVIGPRVLDIGCSQGIVCILLAREGINATGVDSNPSAIVYAEADLARQPKEVQKRVRFIESDLFSFDDGGEPYDTVVLGEVLEHQVEPTEFFRKALDFVRVNGRLVATTPFGYAPHDDHKSTMFLSWVLGLASMAVKVVECEVADGTIQLVVEKLPGGSSTALPSLTQLLRKTESGALNSQRRLHAMIQQRQSRVEELEQKCGRLNEERLNTAVVQEVLDSVRSADSLKEHVAVLKSELDLVPKQIESLRQTVDALNKYRNIDQLAAEIEGANDRDKSFRQLALHTRRSLQDVDIMQGEVRRVRGSASYALGSTIIRSVRSPIGWLLLPLRVIRVLSNVIQSRNVRHGSEEPSVVGRLPALRLVGSTPLMYRPSLHADQFYRFKIQVFGESEPFRKRLLLEVATESGDIDQFLKINKAFRKKASTGCAFLYIDTNAESSVECVSLAIQTKQAFCDLKLSLRRFRGSSSVLVMLEPMESVGRSERPAAHHSAGRLVPSRPPRYPIDVLSVLDTFTERCLSPEVKLIPVSKNRWRQDVDAADAKLLFVESAWRGNNGQWNYALTKPDRWGSEIKQLIGYCRKRGIPTVFWNKEDPVNFETFIEAAAWFDFVFTTDAGSVPRYNHVLGHAEAHVLPFACQPAIHNPIRNGEMIPRVAFAGSWRGVKYPQRAQWIETLLGPLADAGILDIFDRYATETGNPDLIFPARFAGSLRGSLDYDRLVADVYKRYYAFVSVNSVESSETMLARRVFEMLACGAPVISSPSRAIESCFGDLVLTPTTPSQALDVSERLLSDDIYRESLGARGVRLVHSQHTYSQRLASVCEVAGLPWISQKRKLVSAICVSKRPEFLEHVHTQLSRQMYADLELLFVKNSDGFSDEEIAQRFSGIRRLQILSVPADKTLADGINAALELAGGDYAAKIDDDDYYGANYLSDAMLAFDYCPGVGLVGKRSFFAYVQSLDRTVLRFPGRSYRFCNQVHGGTLLWDRAKVDDLRFQPVQRGTDTRFLADCREKAVKVFSTDQFNFMHVRYADKSRHTWTIEDDEFLEKSVAVGPGLAESYFVC